VFLSIENIFKIEKLDLDHFKTELIQILLKDKSQFIEQIMKSKSVYIILEFIELYLMVFQEKGFKIPNALEHKIAIKLKENEI
jgi:hypothetical protein